ncbi:MAG TPA: MFS transporter [Oscillatoriaceae cyanobacterium]
MASIPNPQENDSHAARVLPWLLGGVGFCIFLGVYAVQSLLPYFRHLFHASAGQVSLTVSAATIAVALAAPFVGIAIDRWHRRHTIVVALFALAVTGLLAATATSLQTLEFWRFAQGLFVPLAYVATLSYIKESVPAGRVGSTTAAFVTGNVLGGYTGRALTGGFAQQLGWAPSYALLGALGLVGAILVLWKLPHAHRERPPHLGLAGMKQWWPMLRTPMLLAIFAAGFNTLFVQVAMFTYVNFHLAAAPYNLGSGALASIFAVYLLGVVVTPQAGKLIDRFGYRLVFFGATATALAGVLLTLAPPLWAVVTGLAVCASGVFVCQSAATSSLGMAAGPRHSLASGLYLTFYYLGGSVGGALPGVFWQSGGWFSCVLLVGALQIVTMAIAWVFWPRHEARTGAPGRGEAKTGLVEA